MSKNLYDNFRKNGRNLRQQPSGRAWKRLESRLDGSQGVQRTLHTRWWVMAASVLLLVSAVMGITLTTERSNTMTAKNEAGAFFASEDLTYTDTDVQNIAAVQLQKRIESADWQPINEGKAGSRLVAVFVNKSPSRTANADPQVSMVQDVTSPTPPSKKERSKIKEQAEKDAKTNKPAVTTDTPKPVTTNSGRSGGAYNNFTDYMWLDGNWEVKNSPYSISENWTFNGGHELTNSQTMATSAQMPFIIGLQCRRVMCQMKMVTEPSGETEMFDMTDRRNNRFEYWSLGKGYPEVVLIEKLDENNYTLTISGGQVGTKQKEYFTKSGFVFGRDGAAVRTLKRK
ncbi:MAG: hypothetical protein ACI85O_000892 [Saprospiraceae bacterium]|jgi:hypothetical protein